MTSEDSKLIRFDELADSTVYVEATECERGCNPTELVLKGLRYSDVGITRCG